MGGLTHSFSRRANRGYWTTMKSASRIVLNTTLSSALLQGPITLLKGIPVTELPRYSLGFQPALSLYHFVELVLSISLDCPFLSRVYQQGATEDRYAGQPIGGARKHCKGLSIGGARGRLRGW